jgi:hypothetical protein
LFEKIQKDDRIETLSNKKSYVNITQLKTKLKIDTQENKNIIIQLN